MKAFLYNQETPEKAQVTTIYYQVEYVPEELADQVVYVNELPEPPTVGMGETPRLMYNPSTSELYYEIVERELTEAEKIQQLEQENADLKSQNAQIVLALVANDLM